MDIEAPGSGKFQYFVNNIGLIWYSAIGQTAGENESLVFHSENEYTLAVS